MESMAWNLGALRPRLRCGATQLPALPAGSVASVPQRVRRDARPSCRPVSTASALALAVAPIARRRIRLRCCVAEVKDALPKEVDDYRVRSVCISPSPPLPDRNQICSLVVSDDEDEETMDQVMWNPVVGSSAQQAISALRDAFGVLGVWPAAWVAAQRVMRLCRSRPGMRVLELGCGSGLPSLCALALGAEVVATDLEELPLLLLKAAFAAQDLPGELETQKLDVLQALEASRSSMVCPSDVQRFDVIVCSDCLYKPEVARAIAVLIGRALLAYPMTRVVVTDANRQGRQDFLDELDQILGLSLAGANPPRFEAVPVPPWADPDEADPFDGSMPEEVGLLKLS